MAAGMGTRLRPLTKQTPKPLIRVFGIPVIETVITGLLQRSVNQICVVTGYLREQFEYLSEKYPQVELIYNPYYETQNNISSLYAARDILTGGDCFICEADIFVKDPTIFLKQLSASCYYGRMQKGYSDDWVFDLLKGRISRVGKGGTDTYNMVGISFFRAADAVILKEKIEEAYADVGKRQMFWDEIVNENLDILNIKVEPVWEGQIFEIDTIDDLRAVEAGK